MKKIIAEQFISDPDRRYKLPIDGLNHLQEAYAELLESLIKAQVGTSPSGGYVLYGCVDSTPGPNYVISAGAIYYFMNFTAWSSATTYAAKDNCSKGGFSYTALQASTNKDPETEPDYWAKVGKHQEGQVFLTDAYTLTSPTNVAVCEIQTTFIPRDPTEYTDNTTHKSHPIFKIGYKDAVSGSGIVDFSDLKRQYFGWTIYTPVGGDIAASIGSYTLVGGSILYKKLQNIAIIDFAINLSGGSASNPLIEVTLPDGIGGLANEVPCITAIGGDIVEVCRVRASTNRLQIWRVNGSNFPVLTNGTQFTGQIIVFI